MMVYRGRRFTDINPVANDDLNNVLVEDRDLIERYGGSSFADSEQEDNDPEGI